MSGSAIADALRAASLYRGLSEEDRQRLAEVSLVKSWEKGDAIFNEGDPSDFLLTLLAGRVKVVKLLPSGKEVILEIFGPGDPVGAVVAYEGRPYPATAIALEKTTCLLVRRAPFFALIEKHPSLVRGLLVAFTRRIVELAQRIPEVAGGRVETRFAHLFLKLAERLGRAQGDGTFIPMALSRQDLADLTGTTIETCIRVMSRWGKEGVVETEKDGFRLGDRAALERLVDGR
ncbi:MAG TPA: Crp/Fnr family transcriptional regulator [Vicinamibacteria bacterium]|nr:Crp/Fnr family transcriptional regulator [Vicinamibacteria bacterium]